MSSSHEESASKDVISSFIKWMGEHGFNLSTKLEIKDTGNVSNLGAFAKASINSDELLFVVPRHKILSHATCSISGFLQEHADDLNSKSGWLQQIIAVMYERIMETSDWSPYLGISPNFGEHRLPVLWNEKERQLLKGSGLVALLEEDLQKMLTEWSEILIPFLRKHSDVFSAPEFQSFEYFKETVAFILAYSFTEPEEDDDDDESDNDDDSIDRRERRTNLPYMVPMADILNHSPKNNAEVQYKTDALEIRAIRDISPGEEIFNTYGELSNWELLHCYGFALPPQMLRETACDTVSISLKPDLDEKRWEMLRCASLVSEGASTNLAFNGEGFVNPETAAVILNVACMSDEEFKERTEGDSDGLDFISDLEDELENEFDSLMRRSRFHKLPMKWRNILRLAAERQIKCLPQIEESSNSVMKAFASYVCQSQQRLLKELLQILQTTQSDVPS